MKKSLNDLFKQCAEAGGFHTYMYARIAEANYLMDNVTQYPVLLRQFNETVAETKLRNVRRRTATLYFCDALGKAEPDTETEVRPIVEKMEARAFEFIDRLRAEGVEVGPVTNAVPFYGKFDVLVAGISLSVTLTYSIC